MNLILLPGNSILNKEWIYEMSSLFKSSYKDSEIIVHEYEHWKDNSDGSINIENEVRIINEILDTNKSYFVFAKSAGTMLTMILNQTNPELKIEKAVFVGVPLGFIRNLGKDPSKLISSFTLPTLFLQNENDPYTSYEELLTILNSTDKRVDFKTHMLDGDDHEYSDTELLLKLAIEHFN